MRIDVRNGNPDYFAVKCDFQLKCQQFRDIATPRTQISGGGLRLGISIYIGNF